MTADHDMDCGVCGAPAARWRSDGLDLCDSCFAVEVEHSPEALEARAAALRARWDYDDRRPEALIAHGDADALVTVAGWQRAWCGEPVPHERP